MATTLLDDKPQIITIKEIFERCVALETKMDIQTKVNEDTNKKFSVLAVVIIVLECINFIWNAFIYWR